MCILKPIISLGSAFATTWLSANLHDICATLRVDLIAAIPGALADSDHLSSPSSPPVDLCVLFAAAGITVFACEVAFASTIYTATATAMEISAAPEAANKWVERFAGYARYTCAGFGFAALRFLKPKFYRKLGGWI
jgi:hypothetical protein